MTGWLRICVVVLLSGCRSFVPEDLAYHSVQTADMPRPMEYSVYTPPGWQESERLPMVLHLHGAGDDHTGIEEHGANHFFDAEIAAGRMPRVIVVSPNGRLGFWEDWADGSYLYRSWVLEGVLPDARRRYNMLECPTHCHLMGISMGGFGVLRFAYFASDRFSSVSALSAPIIERRGDERPNISWLVRLFFPLERVFGERFRDNYAEENPYDAWLNNEEMMRLRLQLAWGSEEGENTRASNARLSAHLRDNGFDHDAFEFDGGHKWAYWIPTFNRVMNYLVDPARRVADGPGNTDTVLRRLSSSAVAASPGSTRVP